MGEIIELITSAFFGAQDEADKKALQSVVENNAEGQALYRDLTHDFAHHADVFKKSPVGVAATTELLKTYLVSTILSLIA